MGMPKIELEILDRDIVFNNIIGSIALQEAALSHLLNASGEKLQTAVKLADPSKTADNPISIEELINVNNIVGQFVSKLTDFEKTLQSKLNSVLEYVKGQEKLQDPVEFLFRNFEINTTTPVKGAIWGATGRQPLPTGEYVNVFVTATVDAKGNVVMRLPPGDYTLKQLSVPPPYKILDETFTLVVGDAASSTTINGDEALFVYMYNAK